MKANDKVFVKINILHVEESESCLIWWQPFELFIDFHIPKAIKLSRLRLVSVLYFLLVIQPCYLTRTQILVLPEVLK